jgi:hypothetical protein
LNKRDEEAFQRLLAAAYTLQEQANGLLVRNAELGCGQKVQKLLTEKLRGYSASTPEETGDRAQEPDIRCPATRPYQERAAKLLAADNLFWKRGSVASVILPLTLLLVVLVHRFLPLAAGPSADEGPVRFEKTMAVPSNNFSLRATTADTELPSETRVPTGNVPITADLASTRGTGFVSPKKSNAKSRHLHSDRSEVNIVAKDVVIHYSTASTQPMQKPKLNSD